MAWGEDKESAAALIIRGIVPTCCWRRSTDPRS